MDWRKEFQSKLAGWESADDFTLRREYCLSKLRYAADLGVSDILHYVIEERLPLYALSAEDFPILFELLNRLFKEELSHPYNGFLTKSIKDRLGGTITNLITRGDVRLLGSFMSAAKAYNIPVDCMEVRLNWRAEITPDIVSFFEEHKGDFNFDVTPCYFEGACWKTLGWPDFLRSLALVDRKEVETAIVRAGEDVKDMNIIPYEWNLGSLSMLIITDKIGEDVLSQNFKNLTLAKWVTYILDAKDISDSARAWMKDVGDAYLAGVYKSAMLVAADRDKSRLRRGKMRTMSVKGFESHRGLGVEL